LGLLSETVEFLEGVAGDGFDTKGPGDAATVDRDLGIDQEQFIYRPADKAPGELLNEILSQSTVEIDATWPVAVAPAPAESTRQTTPVAPREDDAGQLGLEDGVRALGNYIVERVSAEFSPGEQYLVLLVDPKPPRSVTTVTTTALDQFAQGSRTSISALGNS
jgi:hypothetical protein